MIFWLLFFITVFFLNVVVFSFSFISGLFLFNLFFLYFIIVCLLFGLIPSEAVEQFAQTEPPHKLINGVYQEFWTTRGEGVYTDSDSSGMHAAQDNEPPW